MSAPIDHREPAPPPPPENLHRPGVYTYTGEVPCPYCGEAKRRAMGRGKRKVVVCFECFRALWPVANDPEQLREVAHDQAELDLDGGDP